MSSNRTDSPLTARQQLVAVVVAAAVIGAIFAPIVYANANEPSGTVAVVELEGPVDTGLADDVENELTDVRNNGSVDAVVLKIDTGGGAPVASERMYSAVQRTSEEMPVIAAVQEISASGGYYAMAPADEIYVLPTSVVGSIGLNAPAPQTTPPIQGPSGPDKVGSNEIEGWAIQQTLADTFIDAMMAERGDEFEMSREEVARANVYLGTEAVRNGFADEIGSLNEAIHAAATTAGLDTYDVDTRETGLDDGLPILLRTDEQVVAVYDNDPGYADVEPMGVSYVYWDSVPHVETIERFSESSLAIENESATGPAQNDTDAAGNTTAPEQGGVGS